MRIEGDTEVRIGDSVQHRLHGAAQTKSVFKRPECMVVTQEAEMTSELPGVATTRVGEAGVSSERVLRSARGQ